MQAKRFDGLGLAELLSMNMDPMRKGPWKFNGDELTFVKGLLGKNMGLVTKMEIPEKFLPLMLKRFKKHYKGSRRVCDEDLFQDWK